MSHSRDTIQGFVIVNKKFLGRGYEVVGIGHEKPAAWRDAAEQQTQGRLDAREMIKQHPEMFSVSAKITISFEVEKATS